MKYVLAIGEMLIDFVPDLSAGEPCYRPHPGGAPANAAVALARLGGSARFIGKLSRDAFGQMLLKTLRENGVDTRYTSFAEGASTTLALVALQEDGQREFSFYRERTADTLLEVTDLDERAWEDVAFCLAGSLLLASDPARAATLAALNYTRLRGLPVSFDVNVRPALWSSEADIRETLAYVISRVDLLKCSAEEAHYLDETRTAPLAEDDSAGVITRGARGALLLNARQSVESPGSSLRAIDTTGAGDAFMGALLYKLLERDRTMPEQLAALAAEELRELGAFANKAAGLSCTRYGGMLSLPYLEEVERA